MAQNVGSGLGDTGSQHPMSVSCYKRPIEQYRSLQSQIQIMKNGKPHYLEVGAVTGQQSTEGPL